MIVSPQEYNKLVSGLINPNEFIHMLRIPEDEPIYRIDLNERKIYAPTFLSVEEDHNSEIIWFETDRFFDNYDLYNSTCWIQYRNAERKEYYYAAPLVVSTTRENGKEKILIPWAISKEVAAKTGTVQFSFQFFKLSEDKTKYLYILNTQVANSKILSGMRADPLAFLDDDKKNEQDFLPEREWLSNEIARLEEAYRTLSNDYVLHWLEITE